MYIKKRFLSSTNVYIKKPKLNLGHEVANANGDVMNLDAFASKVIHPSQRLGSEVAQLGALSTRVWRPAQMLQERPTITSKPAKGGGGGKSDRLGQDYGDGRNIRVGVFVQVFTSHKYLDGRWLSLSNRLFVRVLTPLIILNVGSTAHAQRVVDQGLVIENVILISPERATPLLHADVVIRDGQIVEVGTNLVVGPHARRIDGRGQFLIPGLIDSHVHVSHSGALDDDAIDAHPELWAAYRAQVPRAYLAFGFTSVVDLDTTPTDKAWFAGARLHPGFYSCGAGIKVANGYMAFHVPPPSSLKFPNLVYEPKEANHWPNR